MKLLGLEFSSNFLWLKNELKMFQSKEIREKGGPALKWAVSEPPTLKGRSELSLNWCDSGVKNCDMCK